LRAAGAKTFTAEHWPSGRGLERHSVGFAALVADDIEALPLTATAATTAAGPAKIGAPRITTGLTTFRLAQVPFLVVLLFALSKREGLAAFGTSDVHVWHDWFLPSKQARAHALTTLVRASPTLALFFLREKLAGN